MTAATHPATFNFGGDVVDHIARTADAPALIWAGAGGAEARFLYSDIARLTAKLASSLDRLGIVKGDRVLIMLPRIPEWQIAMVACLKLGAIPVPCIEMLTAKDILYRATRSRAVAVIAHAEQSAKFEGVEATIRIAVGDAPGWRALAPLIEAGDADFEPVRVEAEDPVLLYFTSGSTGLPKGVLHAARGLWHWRHSAVEWLDLNARDLMWCTADTGWSKAGTSILFGPWSCGACSLFYDGPFDAAERLRLIERYGVTVFCASATELLRLLDQDIGSYNLSRLRRTVSAGEALSRSVVERWHGATGHGVVEAYGQTETLMSLGYRAGIAYRPGSTGVPLAHNDVRVVADGHILPTGDVGDIAIRAPNPQFMLGYWQEPDRTSDCYVEGPDGRWFVTGDRGWQDDDGFVYHRGRSDDVINSSGYRIGPSEVEEALLSLPEIAEAAVVGQPDAERGEIVVAFVVLRDDVDPSAKLAETFQAAVKRATAPYKYPRAIHFLDALPKTLTGKVQRGVLRARLTDRKRG